MRIRLADVAVGIAALLCSAPAANASNVTALDTVNPARPLDDLQPLRRSVADAFVVGLGESIHGAAEETQLKHRVLRFLVERMGFRSVAWEEDWTLGAEIDAYLRTGEGDLDGLMRRMSDQYQTREVADVLRWLRRYNAGHSRKVRFVGVESYYTQASAYDAVAAYVAKTAPDRVAELHAHLDPIRPRTADIKSYVEQYYGLPAEAKQRNVGHARSVHRLVASLARRDALALRHARQIRSFHEFYALEMHEANQHREAHAAASVRWWRANRGRHKIAYWAASPHTANAPNLRIEPPNMRFASAGSHLRRSYGDRYLSIGFTFDHGAVYLGEGRTAVQPKPKRGWFEKRLGRIKAAQFLMDLRRVAPSPWLDGRVRTRGLPDAGSDSFMTGGSLRQWFDVIVHRQTVSPAHGNYAASSSA
jgi:erythromycin esterase